MYKKHKVEDALAATRAASEGGIVAGGGVALLRLSFLSADNVGEKILYESLRAPIKQIVHNAGKNYDTIMERITTDPNLKLGWDAKTNEYVDMFKVGIVDPCSVVYKAVENAVSMAIMFLSAESLIVDTEEKKEEHGTKTRR